MHFGNPDALWLMLLWPVLLLLGWLTLRWRARTAGRIGEPELLARLYPASVRRWRRRRMLAWWIALLLLLFAASRPQYGKITQTIRSQGVNVIIALDCSPSMEAADMNPSRLARAKRDMKTLLSGLTGNRVGVVAFAGTAFLQCPMTLDRALAGKILDSIDTTSVGVPGTDIGQAIHVSAEALERGADDGGRALVLITDGEDNEGQGIEQAKQAAEHGLVIYALGFGSPRGSTLSDPEGGFKEDSQGNKVNTRLDMSTLEQIAQATGGVAYQAGDAPRQAIDDIAYRISQQQKTELERRRENVYQDRFHWFLLPALLLLLWAAISRPEQPEIGATVAASGNPGGVKASV